MLVYITEIVKFIRNKCLTIFLCRSGFHELTNQAISILAELRAPVIEGVFRLEND
jgi:hypothetical protein